MQKRILAFVYDEDGGWSTGEWAVNAYRRMFMRARGCFGYGLTAGGDLDALGNAGGALPGSEAYRQKTDPYCNPA